MERSLVGLVRPDLPGVLFERHPIDCRSVLGHGLDGLRTSLFVLTSERRAALLSRGMRGAA